MADQRRLSAIMFTDIVGYGALTQRDEFVALQLLERHRQLLRPLCAAHGGEEIKSIGDGFLLAFASALAAVRCAIEMQSALTRSNAAQPPERRLQIRIGIHIGDVEHRGGDVFGDGVNIASRLETLAGPEEILLSEDVVRQVRNKIDRPLVSLGRRELKNMEGTMGVYRVDWRRTARSGGAPRRRLGLWWGASALLILLAALGWWLSAGPAFGPAGQAPPATAAAGDVRPGEIRSIAVLPLVNLSNDDEYFSDGLTEELINAVAQIEGLRVISRTSAFSYKGTDTDLQTIGRELNVDAILQGSVRKAGDTVRISTQLIRVADDSHLWTETYEEQVSDIFSIQERIAQATVETLKLQLSAAAPLVQPATANFEAYEHYLRGRFFWNKRTQSGFDKAIAEFQQALAIDPHYAKAYAGLADAYSLMVHYDLLLPAAGVPLAKEAALHALASDEHLAEAHTALAFILSNYELDSAGATEHYERAIEINPNYATAYQWYAGVLFSQGKLAEAEAAAQRALELDPLSPVINANLGQRYAAYKLFDRARERFQRALELDPQFQLGYVALAGAQIQERDWAAALQTYEQAIAVNPGNALVHHAYALALLRVGRWEEGFEEILQGLHLNPDTVLGHVVLGQYHYFNHDYAKAVEQAEVALQLNAQEVDAYVLLAVCRLQQGRFEDALAAVAAAQGLVAQGAQVYAATLDALRALVLARQGERDQARALLAQLSERTPAPQTSLWTMVALIHVELGEVDRAFDWLEQALEAQETALLDLNIDPLFDPLRGDSRFSTLQSSLGLL